MFEEPFSLAPAEYRVVLALLEEILRPS